MCLERSHSSQSRWPAEKRSQTYRRCDEAGWLSSEKGSGGKKKNPKKRLEEFAKDGFSPQMKKFNNMSRWASKCPFSRRGCLTPGVARNAAKTSPSPRRALCAVRATLPKRSDGRRDVKAERGEKMGKEEEYETSASCQDSGEGTFGENIHVVPLKRCSDVNNMNRCFAWKDDFERAAGHI